MSSPTMTTRQLISLGLAVLVITSSFVPAIEARKIGGRKSSGSSSKSKPSGGSRPSTHYNPVSLSYPSSHSARPAPPKAPSAPQQPQQPAVGWNTNSGNNQAGAANSRPIGWNVNNNNNQGIPKATAPQQSNAAPPPYSPNFPPQQGHAPAGAPPPYSNAHPNGPPPAYSPQQPQYNPNQAYHPPQGSPPAYSPHAPAAGYPQQPGYAGHGYQQPGYQQPAYGHQQPGYPGGYPQQQYPGGGGGYGGYPQPGGGGFGGYGQQPVINNYYQKGGGGNGLTNALLLGVGGLSLYSALKPGETKVIYINNSTNPEDARTVSQNGTHVLVSDNNNMTVATPLAPFPPDCSQFMGMPLPPQYFNQTANLSGNSSVSGAVTTPTPLAPFPETTTMVAGQMETTTLTGEIIGNATEAGETTTMTTMVAPPAAGGLNETSPTYVPASMVNATVASPPPINSPPVPIIPAECIPFMTGQVVPTNYTGPGPFVGAPANLNPVQGGPPPQWPQANPGAPPAQQQQQSAGLNSVPVEGVQKSGAVNNYAVSVTVFVVAFACSVL